MHELLSWTTQLYGTDSYYNVVIDGILLYVSITGVGRYRGAKRPFKISNIGDVPRLEVKFSSMVISGSRCHLYATRLSHQVASIISPLH